MRFACEAAWFEETAPEGHGRFDRLREVEGLAAWAAVLEVYLDPANVQAVASGDAPSAQTAEAGRLRGGGCAVVERGARRLALRLGR